MMKIRFLAASFIICTLVGYSVGSPKATEVQKFAQAQPRTQAAPTPPVSTQTKPKESLPSQQIPDVKQRGDELQKLAEDTNKRLEEIAKSIKEGIETDKRANEIYGSMVAAVKGLIDQIGPQSDYRKDLDQLIAALRRNAEEWAKSTNPNVRALSKTMTDGATTVEKLVSDANNEYARGLGAIREIEEGREEAVAYMKTKSLQKAMEGAARFLDTVRSFIDKTIEFGKRTKETAPGS